MHPNLLKSFGRTEGADVNIQFTFDSNSQGSKRQKRLEDGTGAGTGTGTGAGTGTGTGTLLPAHSIILSAASEYFSVRLADRLGTLGTGGGATGRTVLDLPLQDESDVEPARLVLRMMYGATADVPGSAEQRIETLVRAFRLADRPAAGRDVLEEGHP